MTCQQILRTQGKPYPRTCADCGLGPCKIIAKAIEDSNPQYLTLATDYALRLLAAGWTVRHKDATDEIEWRSPCGLWSSTWVSMSLDDPPSDAITWALQQGQITEAYRSPVR